MPCTFPLPVSYITQDEADVLTTNYVRNKLELLSQFTGDSFDTKCIPIQLEAIESLNKLILNDEAATGLRCYLAGNLDGFLTLVFCVTYNNGVNEKTDYDTFYYLDNHNALVQFPSLEDASVWVYDRFRNTKWVAINNDISMTATNLTETKSIWYSKAIVAEWVAEINCLTVSGLSISSLAIYFGAYSYGDQISIGKDAEGNDIMADVSNQIMLIWSLIYEDGAGNSIKDNYDTGTPCPPAVGCPGSIFP